MSEAPESKQHILVVVHPGSACGSANFNLGTSDARAARDGLCCEINQWNDGVIIIDGEYSDELPRYRNLRDALENVMKRAAAAGHPAIRVMGDDPEQSDRIRELIEERKELAGASFTVTGAWYLPDDGGACVDSVIEELTRLGCEAKVGDYAVGYGPKDDDEEEENDDEPETAPKSAIARP